MPDSAAVALADISFSYARNGAPLLRVPALQIDRGERIFLYGPSGSGKSTLLGLIAGVLVPQRGSVEVLGKDLTRLSLSARDRHRGSEMGYIFQSLNLIPYLNVRENIALPCEVHAERRKRIVAGSLHDEVTRLAQRLDLDPSLLDRPVTRLSIGQQQRVAIARAIIGRPQLIIADEPTSALDTDRREQFLELLLEICNESGSTLIFVSHDRTFMHLFGRHISLTDLAGTQGSAA